LIRRVTARATPGGSTLLGPGDDAAVLRAPDGRVVVSTDLLVEGRHFRRDWSTAYDVGRRAAAANLADIAAMGAVPTGIVVGLACPPELPLEWTDGLTDGLREECDLVGAGVVGGDVSRSAVLVVAVTALDALSWMLAGGDDHALAASFPAGVALPPHWRVVGRVVAGTGVLIDGEEYTGPGGWDHFG